MPLLIVKMRKSGVPPAVLRCTIIWFAPGPLIDIELERSGNAVKRAIVPVKPAWKLIALVSALALASVIACRKLPAPLSAVFVTRRLWTS